MFLSGNINILLCFNSRKLLLLFPPEKKDLNVTNKNKQKYMEQAGAELGQA